MVTLKITFKGIGASKKNHQHIVTLEGGRQIIAQHKRYKNWVKGVKPQVEAWMAKQAEKYGFIYPLAHVKMRCKMFFPDLKERDGVGREEAIFDMFRAHKLILNDSWINCDSFHWDAALDRENPRIEVYIVVIDPDQSQWLKFLKQKSRSKRLKATTTIRTSTPIPIE